MDRAANCARIASIALCRPPTAGPRSWSRDRRGGRPAARGRRPRSLLRGVQQQRRGDRRCNLGRRLITSSLQSRDSRIGCGYLGISDGQERVHARGVCVGQQSRGDALINICGRGLQVHRSSQVSGAGAVQERVRNLGVNIQARLLCREVQGQLIGDGAQGIIRGHAGQGGVVGARYCRIHGCRVAEGLELRVHAGRRTLGRHFELQRVQRGLVRLAGQACCEARP